MEIYLKSIERKKKEEEKEINYIKKKIFDRSFPNGISYIRLGNSFIKFENESGYYKYLQNKS